MITTVEGQTVWTFEEPTLEQITSGDYTLPVNFKVVDTNTSTYKLISFVSDSDSGARRLELGGGSLDQENIPRLITLTLEDLGMTSENTEEEINQALADYINGLNLTIGEKELYFFQVDGFLDFVEEITSLENSKLDKGSYSGNSAQDLKNDIDNIKIGGRNLLLNTKSEWQTFSGTGYGIVVFPKIEAKISETFTVKAFVRNSTSPTPITLEIHEVNSSNQRVKTYSQQVVNGIVEKTITTENANIAFLEVNLFFGADYGTTTHQYEYSKVKLERGNKATDWTPAPEDKQDNLQNITGNIGVGKTNASATEKLDINGNVKSNSYKFTLPSVLTPTPNTLVPKTDGSGLIWYDNSGVPYELFYIPTDWSLGRTPNNSYNYNVRIGVGAMINNSYGENNVGIGRRALEKLTMGSYNTAIGNYSGNFITTNEDNVFVGAFAGHFNTAGNNLTNVEKSTFLGSYTKGTQNSTNEIVIGYNASGAGSNTATLGNASITSTFLKGIVNTSRSFKLKSYTKAERNALTNKEVGEMIWQTDSGNSGIRVYDGTNWLAIQTIIN